MTPVVSVLLPFFNAKRWLGGALRSLFGQRGLAFEVIAVDDHSSDGGADVVEDTRRAGLPVTLLTNSRNLGIVASLNSGLEAAKGRFIARMDADDVACPDRLFRQVDFIQESKVDICGSWFVEFGQGIPRTVRWPCAQEALRAAMMFQNTICHPTVMARREVFEKFRYREEYRLVEDYDLFSRAMRDFRMANVPDVLLRYRRHPAQATQAKRDRMEALTKRVRLEVLEAEGIKATDEEQRLHNMIRAPESIRSVGDLERIESWLLKLAAAREDGEAKAIIASQWVRACIRAAPLGSQMFRTYHASPLLAIYKGRLGTSLDLAMLAVSRLDYRSSAFMFLRRFGLSA